MPITKVVQAWMDAEGWTDDIEVSDDRLAARVAKTYIIDGQCHPLFFDIDEDSGAFCVVLYDFVKVAPERMVVMARILNRINMRLRFGRLACHDDENSNPVQFLAGIDLWEASLPRDQIGKMLGECFSTMVQYGPLLARTALTKQSADDLWVSFLEREAADDAFW
ncbi:MAG: YbjN domain-containing protein [Alphaproteobacteria bacterium]|nr:YbjN domain-containing protein [Alphaproteobacteria bacterium]